MAPVLALAVLIVGSLFAGRGGIGCCREVFQTFWGADKLSIAVAQAMPAEKYGFRAHPESMTFGN